jgi:acyl-coenzyme A thioesterase PaaI-like protein
MPPSFDQARVALAAQPFSRLLGAQLNRFGPDGVELRVPVCPAHRQQHGFAHGGRLGYAADNALPSPPGRWPAPRG